MHRLWCAVALLQLSVRRPSARRLVSAQQVRSRHLQARQVHGPQAGFSGCMAGTHLAFDSYFETAAAEQQRPRLVYWRTY